MYLSRLAFISIHFHELYLALGTSRKSKPLRLEINQSMRIIGCLEAAHPFRASGYPGHLDSIICRNGDVRMKGTKPKNWKRKPQGTGEFLDTIVVDREL